MSYFVIWKEFGSGGFDCYSHEASTKEMVLEFLNQKEFLEGEREIIKVVEGTEISLLERKVRVPSYIEKTQFEIQ